VGFIPAPPAINTWSDPWTCDNLDQTQVSIDQISKEAEEVVLDSDRWLRTPHELLGGREPMDLIIRTAKLTGVWSGT
jgi:hypothetical protein